MQAGSVRFGPYTKSYKAVTLGFDNLSGVRNEPTHDNLWPWFGTKQLISPFWVYLHGQFAAVC